MLKKNQSMLKEESQAAQTENNQSEQFIDSIFKHNESNL